MAKVNVERQKQQDAEKRAEWRAGHRDMVSK